MEADGAHARGGRAVPSTPARGASAPRRLPCALPREPREPRSRGPREVVRRARRDDGDGTGDRCRHGRLPRRLAPRLRLRRRGARGGSCASRAPVAHDGGPLAVPRKRGRRRRDDRAVRRRARRHLRRARRARAAGHLPRLLSLVGVRRRRDEPFGAGRGARRPRRTGRARSPPPAARQRREDAARLEPRPARGRRRRPPRRRARDLPRSSRLPRPARGARDVARRRSQHGRHGSAPHAPSTRPGAPEATPPAAARD